MAVDVLEHISTQHLLHGIDNLSDSARCLRPTAAPGKDASFHAFAQSQQLQQHQQHQQHQQQREVYKSDAEPTAEQAAQAYDAQRREFVSTLIDTTAHLISTIFPPPPYNPAAPLTPLPVLISSLLRRSHTSCSTLQLSLIYLVRLRLALTGGSATNVTSTSAAGPATCIPQPYLCGRRMFLACLIIASKYLQDKTYSNKAWSKISGLALDEINRAEREVLRVLEWKVGVGKKAFWAWGRVLRERGRIAHLGIGASVTAPSTNNTAAIPTAPAPVEEKMHLSYITIPVQPPTVVPQPVPVPALENSIQYPRPSIILSPPLTPPALDASSQASSVVSVERSDAFDVERKRKVLTERAAEDNRAGSRKRVRHV